MNAVDTKNAVKRFRGHSDKSEVAAVDNISLSLAKNERLALLGPSGCGKTTLLRCIAGLNKIDQGEIIINGITVDAPAEKKFVPPEARGVGLVFQSYALWPHLTVWKNIVYGLEVRGFTRQEKERRVKEVLEIVGLQGLENRYPAQLSGGQQQRVAVARSLVYEPAVLLFDEPLSNLDLKERERMRWELKKILQNINFSTLYVTHDQEEAFSLCDRIVVMNKGKSVQEGTPREIYENPSCFFVANFIGRGNILKGKIETKNPTTRLGKIELYEPRGVELECLISEELAQGDECYVNVKAAEMGLTETKPTSMSNVIEAIVTNKQYVGSTINYKVAIGNAELLAMAPRTQDFSEGKKVYLQISLKALAILPC
jgi:iron(III) transport system ATP-binding protein